MVCLPHAGGSASYFPWLRRALSADGELVCVQYPGRQERRREPAIEDVPTMVASIAVALGERLKQDVLAARTAGCGVRGRLVAQNQDTQRGRLLCACARGLRGVIAAVEHLD